MHPAKLKLLLFAVIVFAWQGFSLWNEFNYLKKSINESEVLGAAVNKSYTFPILPDYPILKQTAPKFAAKNYALYDVTSGIFLLEQDAENPVPLASTTKVMTSLLTLEQGKLNDIYVVDQKSSAQIGSTVLLRPGERITVQNLLYAALLNSGNDAAFSLGHYVGSKQIGSDGNSQNWEEAINSFVNRMNSRAKELGLESFNFVDPSGLGDENIGSARDMAKLAAYALQNEQFKNFVSTKELTVTNVEGNIAHQLKNSNRLVSEWNYPGAIGVKTGFTPTAGHNLVAAVNWNGHILVAVVFNTYDATNTASAEVARDILDFASRSVEWR